MGLFLNIRKSFININKSAPPGDCKINKHVWMFSLTKIKLESMPSEVVVISDSER